LNAKGDDSQSNPTVAKNIRTLKLEILDSAEVTIANSSASSTVEVASSNAELLRFSSEVENGSATLTGLKVTGTFTGLADKEIITAEINGSTYTTEYTTGSTTIEFTGLNVNLPVSTYEVKLTANINSDAATN
jgi:lipopolysaccharide export system protein LptA